MTTSKTDEHTLCSLSFTTTPDYQVNLQTLLTLIEQVATNSIIVAPEVCLTGFDYEHFDKVVLFAPHANEEIRRASKDKIIVLTIIEKKGDEVFNFAKVFHNGELIHERAKAKLFRFGGEHNYFSEGGSKQVEIVEVDGVKLGILVCFELRFKELWKQLEGCDVIAVPSWWGVSRTEHFKILTNALAVMNQCFVIASDSANEECTKTSAIINPNGDVNNKGNTPCLEQRYDEKEIALIRRYMDVGIG